MMNKLLLMGLLLTLAGCSNACSTDACYAQRYPKLASFDRMAADARAHPTPPYVAFAKTEIGCIVYYSLGQSDLKSLTVLKREGDIPAYNEQKRRLIASHRCRMFKKGTKIMSGNGANGTSADISASQVRFRLKGNPTRYVTFRDALKPADETAPEE